LESPPLIPLGGRRDKKRPEVTVESGSEFFVSADFGELRLQDYVLWQKTGKENFVFNRKTELG
jgi:hypothetical protein